MEKLQPLSLESFSYRWLVSMKSGSDTSNVETPSFIDIDPRHSSFRRKSEADVCDFDFGISSAHHQLIADADKIIAGGLLLPLELTSMEEEHSKLSHSPDSVLTRSTSADSTRVLLSLSRRYEIPSFPMSANTSPAMFRRTTTGNWRKPKLAWFGNCGSKKIIKKYLCFLVPLFKKVKGLRTEKRSQPPAGAFVGTNWHRPNKAAAVVDEDVEKSILEAVLHCKKSNGKDDE